MAVTVDARNPRFRLWVETHRDSGTLPPQELHDSVIEIVTQKRLDEPAGGFQITLVPRRVLLAGGGYSSFHDVFQPMDFVRIELWVPPDPPTVIMRGFVDTVVEHFDIASGRPSRFIIVAGRDYGQLPLITKPYHPSAAIHQGIEIFRRWFEAIQRLFGCGKDDLPRGECPARGYYQAVFSPTDMLKTMWEEFVEPQQELIVEHFQGTVPRARFVSEVDEKAAAVKTWDPAYKGRMFAPLFDVWALMREYQHAPWRELFLVEEGDTPIFVYRPTPWLDLEGQFIQGPTPSVRTWNISEDQVVRRVLSRSQKNIFNFFETNPEGFNQMAMLRRDFPTLLEGYYGGEKKPLKSNPYLLGEEEGDATYKLVGMRIKHVFSVFFDVNQKAPEGELGTQIKDLTKQGVEANLMLKDAYGHGGWLEEGQFTLKGDTRIRIGDYLRLAEPGARYYVTGVTHRFRQATQQQDGHFFTDVQVERGRGHLIRLARGAP